MASAPSGIIGKIAANRPLLITGVLAALATALCVVGVRRSGANPEDARLIFSVVANALIVLGAPALMVAAAPQRLIPKFAYFIFFGGLIVLAIVNNQRGWFNPELVDLPHTPVLLAMLGLTVFFAVLSPVLGAALRLSFLAPMAAVLGVAGAAGFLSLERVLATPNGGAALALGLALGAAIGAGVGVDYARLFAGGDNRMRSAAGAAHAAIAPTVFSILAVFIMFAVQTVNVNFGAVDWRVAWGALTATILGGSFGLFCVSGALALSSLGEAVAAAENTRRKWFSVHWRPLRQTLPASSAFAFSAIAGIFVVIAVFEAGETAPFSVFAFLGLVWAAAAVIFVSLRTSLLILTLLAMSILLMNYTYAILGFAMPGLLERLAAMVLTSVALGQLTVSWRDAGDKWRHARDIAEHAMNDGVRRYVLTLGFGAAAFFAVAASGAWGAGIDAAVYFIGLSSLSLLLAPALMTAMSARYGV